MRREGCEWALHAHWQRAVDVDRDCHRLEGKLIAAISQCPQGSVHMGAYAAGHGLNNAGVLSGDDMTPEAAYTKLVHVLAQPISLEDQRRRFLTTLVGER